MDPASALSDDQLTRALARAVAVEPSPTCVARVRAQIANEALGMALAGTAGATGWLAAVALVGLAFWLPHSGSVSPASVPDSAASASPFAGEPTAEPAPAEPITPAVNEPPVRQSAIAPTTGGAFRRAVTARAFDATPRTRKRR